MQKEIVKIDQISRKSAQHSANIGGWWASMWWEPRPLVPHKSGPAYGNFC